jgi:hypothetical protein
MQKACKYVKSGHAFGCHAVLSIKLHAQNKVSPKKDGKEKKDPHLPYEKRNMTLPKIACKIS